MLYQCDRQEVWKRLEYCVASGMATQAQEGTGVGPAALGTAAKSR